MAQPAFITKTLRMSPDVTKIFDDLDEWLDHCRFNLMRYDPRDLYRSKEYKEFARQKNGERRPRRDRPQRGE